MTPEEMKSKIAEVETAREAKLAELAAARDAKVLEEKIALIGLEEKHGLLGHDIEAVFSPRDGRMFVVKMPSQIAGERFMARLMSDKLDQDEQSKVVTGCLVYPKKAEFETACKAYPFLLSLVVNAVAKMAKASKEDAAGK